MTFSDQAFEMYKQLNITTAFLNVRVNKYFHYRKSQNI